MKAQGRSRLEALRLLPALIALGAGIAPHLTAAVFDGLRTTAGEFVRTPKRGSNRWRYRASVELPLVELTFAALTGACCVVSVKTGHYFATPFTFLFSVGYGYIAFLLLAEALGRRGRQRLTPAVEGAPLQPEESSRVDLAA
jgi:hypothetical protein